MRLGLRCIPGSTHVHAQLFGRKVNLKILKMGRLRLGRVKVTWCVGGWLSSDKRYSQRFKPEFPM